MEYKEMCSLTKKTMDGLKEKIGPRTTVLIMVADEQGAWVVDWNWAHPMIAYGLAQLGVISIDRIIRGQEVDAVPGPPGGPVLEKIEGGKKD